MSTLGTKLKALADASGVTQARIAAVADTSGTLFGRWLTGQNKPSIYQVLKLARHFGVPMEYLADDEMSAVPATPPTLTPDEEWLVSEYRAARIERPGLTVGLVTKWMHSDLSSNSPPARSGGGRPTDPPTGGRRD